MKMELQQMYQLSYALFAGMFIMLFIAVIYGITNNVKKAYRFTRKYKNKAVETKVRKKAEATLPEAEETVLLEETKETQILIQDETFYGINICNDGKNVLNTANWR